MYCVSENVKLNESSKEETRLIKNLNWKKTKTEKIKSQNLLLQSNTHYFNQLIYQLPIHLYFAIFLSSASYNHFISHFNPQSFKTFKTQLLLSVSFYNSTMSTLQLRIINSDIYRTLADEC